MFTQTANRWHQLAMLTSSRCVLGTVKMLRCRLVAAGCEARLRASARLGEEEVTVRWTVTVLCAGALHRSSEWGAAAREAVSTLEQGGSQCPSACECGRRVPERLGAGSAQRLAEPDTRYAGYGSPA